MADSGVTVTGLKEARAAVDALPETITRVSKGIAKTFADRIAVNAASMLRSKTHGTGKTAASIRVLDESADQQYTVNVPGDPEDPANLPLWLERGTRHMVARPFLRPAGDAESESYKREMAAVLERTVTEALK
jgi:HK97 gp10 family phage protein